MGKAAETAERVIKQGKQANPGVYWSIFTLTSMSLFKGLFSKVQAWFNRTNDTQALDHGNVPTVDHEFYGELPEELENIAIILEKITGRREIGDVPNPLTNKIDTIETLRKALDNGLILYGPPGVGKTYNLKHVVARALGCSIDDIDRISQLKPARKTDNPLESPSALFAERLPESPFIEIPAQVIANMFVGESQKIIALLMQHATKMRDKFKFCIVMLDEIDQHIPNRTNSSNGQSNAAAGIASSFISQLGSTHHPKGVLLCGGTNLPDSIDTAGLSRVCLVGLAYPSLQEKTTVLKGLIQKSSIVTIPENEIAALANTENLGFRDISLSVQQLLKYAGTLQREIENLATTGASQEEIKAHKEAASIKKLRSLIQENIAKTMKRFPQQQPMQPNPTLPNTFGGPGSSFPISPFQKIRIPSVAHGSIPTALNNSGVSGSASSSSTVAIQKNN